ncbi:hypothetical protein [Actinomadura verrucosospora]|uniref:Uncharacterized protein n=1 Tax=Actinomadura verrucosospora TaxID=46165 RepID=A0A7D3VUV1_ACTVE|nr:hypothetical protein [Actinomadura verrucosospora]QKG23258.1 hypothetical protein ACTIVE_4901 [Actinomadura verrucosospora]
MNELTDYVLAVRVTGSPSAPEGVKSVDVTPPAGAGDITAAAVEGLRAGGLTPADLRSRVIFLAPDDPGCLVSYAALCGFAGRRLDAYADGAVLEFSRLDPDGSAFPDEGRPDGHLMWAQAGGPGIPEAPGMPTVRLALNTPGLAVPEAVTVIRYAARLRMAAPAAVRDALAMLLLIAAIRRRGDDRFPYLSTGSEPAPTTKDDPTQGIDLEKIRRAAAEYRKTLRAGRKGAEVVPAVPVSVHDQRIADANAVSVTAVLARLGSTADPDGRWSCPRPDRHDDGDQDTLMKVSGDNRVRCRRCDAEKIGTVRLVVDVLGLTPDEAAAFILDSTQKLDVRSGWGPPGERTGGRTHAVSA